MKVDPTIFDIPWWNPVALVDADVATGLFVAGLMVVVFVATSRFFGRLKGWRAALPASLGAVLAVLSVLEMTGAYRDGPAIGDRVEEVYAVSEVGEVNVRAIARDGSDETTATLDDGEQVTLGITADTDTGRVTLAVRDADVPAAKALERKSVDGYWARVTDAAREAKGAKGVRAQGAERMDAAQRLTFYRESRAAGDSPWALPRVQLLYPNGQTQVLGVRSTDNGVRFEQVGSGRG